MSIPAVVPITLITRVNSIAPSAYINAGMNPVWQGFAYRWLLSITVKAQNHSDETSPIPFAYTGLDVQVNDWLVFSKTASQSKLLEFQVLMKTIFKLKLKTLISGISIMIPPTVHKT